MGKVEKPLMPNTQLADKYYTVMCNVGCQQGMAKVSYRRTKESIENAAFNLDRYYREHEESFGKLEVHGVGPKTREVLELILTCGANGTIDLLAQTAARIRNERRESQGRSNTEPELEFSDS
jgi:DNA polymerase/3'-5' exonuclease PolX